MQVSRKPLIKISSGSIGSRNPSCRERSGMVDKPFRILKTRLMIPLQLGQCAATMSVATRSKSQTNRPERLHVGSIIEIRDRS